MFEWWYMFPAKNFVLHLSPAPLAACAVCIKINAVPVKNVAYGLRWLPLLEAVRHAFLFREPEGASVNWLSLFRVFVFSKPIATCRRLLVFPEILWLRRICVGMVCEPTSRRSNLCFAFCTARRRNVNLKYSVTCVVPLDTAVWVHRRPAFTKTSLDCYHGQAHGESDGCMMEPHSALGASRRRVAVFGPARPLT